MASNNSIWNLLVSSGLVTSSSVAEIRTHCEGDLGEASASDSRAILTWLREQKRISGYQMQVLAEGQPGPFRFEQYRVHARNTGGPLEGSFRARHIATNHPVRLNFFGGDSPQDAQNWAEIRYHAIPLTQVNSPFVGRCYEVVEDGEYRFVVFEEQAGKPLSEKLPYKGRLPWPQTLQAIELLALGLANIHQSGVAHGRIWPGAIWLQRGGICQLLWQVPNLHYDPDQPAELAKIPKAFQAPAARNGNGQHDVEQAQRDDLFSLGALAFRMISGRIPKIKSESADSRSAEIDKHLAYCEKHKLPENVGQLMRLLLTADISSDLKDASIAAKITGTILESQSIKRDTEPDLPTLRSYEETISQKNRSQGFLNTLESIEGDQLTEVPKPVVQNTPDFSGIATGDATISARHRLEKRKSARSNRLPLLLGASILSAAVLMGVVLGGMFSKDDQTAGADTTDVTTDNDPEVVTDPENLPENTEPVEVAAVLFRPQNIVEDNDEVPWESPTGAEPIDVRLMPGAPDVILALRPRLLEQNQNALRFLQSLGPRFDSLAKSLTATTGVKPTEMERVNVSLHSNGAGQYHTVVIIELASPLDQEDLWNRMNKPQVNDVEEAGLRTFELESGLVYFEPNDEQSVSRLAWGPTEFVNESLDSMGPAMAGRTISKLLDRSDRDRHITLIFRCATLLSEEGQWLFEGELASLRRPFGLFLDDRMEGVKLSLHFDQGSYVEWMSEQTQDLDDAELLEVLPRMFTGLRDQLTSYVSQIPPHPYWAPVQQRFDNMLNELVKQIRVGRERDGIVANCWLPEVAPHNLMTAGELVLNGTRFASGEVIADTGPGTLQELLDTPRDLTVTSDPDLINLLRDIEQEIRDDYPQLPFEFKIRLLGNDLAVDGITQNQRPGNIAVSKTPLGEILARIMLQANPDKSATSPADEKCNLVWLIGDDPDEPGTQAILVTTRKAAVERNLELPALFQSE